MSASLKTFGVAALVFVIGSAAGLARTQSQTPAPTPAPAPAQVPAPTRTPQELFGDDVHAKAGLTCESCHTRTAGTSTRSSSVRRSRRSAPLATVMPP